VACVVRGCRDGGLEAEECERGWGGGDLEDGGDDCVGARAERHPAALVWSEAPGARRIRWPFRPFLMAAGAGGWVGGGGRPGQPVRTHAKRDTSSARARSAAAASAKRGAMERLLNLPFFFLFCSILILVTPWMEYIRRDKGRRRPPVMVVEKAGRIVEKCNLIIR
jgi:hypothetical protein